jgi:hypothetical protein
LLSSLSVHALFASDASSGSPAHYVKIQLYKGPCSAPKCGKFDPSNIYVHFCQKALDQPKFTDYVCRQYKITETDCMGALHGPGSLPGWTFVLLDFDIMFKCKCCKLRTSTKKRTQIIFTHINIIQQRNL